MNPTQPSQQNYALDNTDAYAQHEHRHDIVERLIVLTGSALSTLLVLRFILALFGANPANSFANFVYNFSAPFVTPFFNLFSYDHPSLGIATFEGYTLVALGVYALVTAGIVRVISITRH